MSLEKKEATSSKIYAVKKNLIVCQSSLRNRVLLQINNDGQSEERKIRLRANETARENAGDQVVIGFSFASDWLKERHKFSGPITERCEAKTKISQITFATPLKIALSV